MGEPGGEPLETVAVRPEDVGDEPYALARLAEQPLQAFGWLRLLGNGNQLMGTPVPLREMCSTSVNGAS